LRDPIDQASQFIEAPNAMAHVPEDDALPFSANDFKRSFDRAIHASFFHDTIPPNSAYLPELLIPNIVKNV